MKRHSTKSNFTFLKMPVDSECQTTFGIPSFVFSSRKKFHRLALRRIVQIFFTNKRRTKLKILLHWSRCRGFRFALTLWELFLLSNSGKTDGAAWKNLHFCTSVEISHRFKSIVCPVILPAIFTSWQAYSFEWNRDYLYIYILKMKNGPDEMDAEENWWNDD